MFWQSAGGETVALVTSGAVIALAGYILNKNRMFYKKVDVGLTDAAEVKIALIGEEKTELNPTPQPGLIARVANVEHLLQNGLHADVRAIQKEQRFIRQELERKSNVSPTSLPLV
jgi:hypothetical protein